MNTNNFLSDSYIFKVLPDIALNTILLLPGAYPRQDVAAQMSLRNRYLSSTTLFVAAIVPKVSVMSFSHLCLGFPLLLFPATIPCIIVLFDIL